MTQWLLQVVAHVTLILPVVATFVASLERLVEDPPTIVVFFVLVLQTILSSTTTPKRKIGILEC